MRPMSVISTAPGSGKTTVGRALALRLGVPFVELDALHHAPGWTEATVDELRARVAPILARPGWVVDGGYHGKLGTLVLDGADTVVWLDLSARVWLPRLVRRTVRRLARHEELWNGNRESLRGALGGRDGLLPYAVRMPGRRRREYPERLAGYPVVRLRSQREIDDFVRSAPPSAGTPAAPPE